MCVKTACFSSPCRSPRRCPRFWRACSCPCRWSGSCWWRNAAAPPWRPGWSTEADGAGRNRSERSGGCRTAEEETNNTDVCLQPRGTNQSSVFVPSHQILEYLTVIHNQVLLKDSYNAARVLCVKSERQSLFHIFSIAINRYFWHQIKILHHWTRGRKHKCSLQSRSTRFRENTTNLMKALKH